MDGLLPFFYPSSTSRPLWKTLTDWQAKVQQTNRGPQRGQNDAPGRPARALWALHGGGAAAPPAPGGLRSPCALPRTGSPAKAQQ